MTEPQHKTVDTHIKQQEALEFILSTYTSDSPAQRPLAVVLHTENKQHLFLKQLVTSSPLDR